MTTTIRLITTALLALAVTAPIASARPALPYPPPPWVQTTQQDRQGDSATGAASSPRQDLRNSDNRARAPRGRQRDTAPVAIPPVEGYPRTAEPPASRRRLCSSPRRRPTTALRRSSTSSRA